MSKITVTPVVNSSIHSAPRSFTMKVSTLSLAVLAIFSLASTAQAQTANVQSGLVGGNGVISVGTTVIKNDNMPVPTLPDLPGIGSSNAYNGELISFEALQALGQTSNSGVANNWNWTSITTPAAPYPDIGYFDFIQVANESVYFGEWSQTGVAGDSTHTVYYAGEAGDVVNTLPTQTATYTVVGINNGGILNGTLTANFGGDNLLEGALFHSSLTLDIQAQIDSSDASFAGAAFANTGDGSIALGDSSGHFFGNGATALAGIASFEDVSLNTAFGGIKD